MNSNTIRITANLIIFSAGLFSCLWIAGTYGFGSSSTIFCTTLGLFYILLLALAMAEFGKSKSAVVGFQLPANLSQKLRTAALVIPLLTSSYVILFYVVRSGYCYPGGVDRAELFKLAENALFGKAVCANESLSHLRPILENYLKKEVEPRVKSRWHPPREKCKRETSCSFFISKDGKILRAKIVKPSGSIAFDQAALASLDVSLPELPTGSPDRIELSPFFFTGCESRLYPWGDTIDPACNIANEYLDRASYCMEHGQHRDAITYFQCGLKALVSDRRSENVKNQLKLRILRDLASQAEELRDYASACKFYQEAIAHANKLFPEALPTCLYELGDLQYDFGKYKEALATYTRAAELDPPSNSDWAYTITRRAHCHYALGNYDIAFSQFEKLLEEESICSDRDQESQSFDRRNLCALMLKHGMADRVLKLMDRALSRERAKAGKDNSQKIRALKKELADIYGLLKQKEKQELCLKSALDSARSELGALHPEAVTLREQLADFYWESRMQDKALALFQPPKQSQKLDEHSRRIFDEDLSNALFHKGAFLARKKLWIQAETELRKSFEIRKSLPHLKPRLTRNTGWLLEEVLQVQNKGAEAATIRAYIFEHTNMTDSDKRLSIAAAYLAAGDLDKGIGLYELEIERMRRLLNRRGTGQENRLIEYNIRTILEESFSVCKRNKDPRAARAFQELYTLELRPAADQDRSSFIQICIRQRRLTEAEHLCHLELNAYSNPHSLESKGHFTDAIELVDFEQAHLMSVLAHIKHLQGHRQSAMYYLNRAIAILEPHGFSNEQIVLQGLKAQLLRKNGDLAEAEVLMNTLLQRDLAEENTYNGHDPDPLFKTFGGDAFGTQSTFTEYENSNHEKRADPIESIRKQYYDTDEEASKVEMADLKWPDNAHAYTGAGFLRACTLVALSDLNAELKRIDRVFSLRQEALDQIEENLRNPNCFDCFDQERLIKHLPQSQRAKDLLEKIERENNLS